MNDICDALNFTHLT